MLRVFDRLEASAEVNAIVLTANGRVFCAGADIKEKAALARRRRLCPRQPADARRVLLHSRQQQAGDRRRAGRRARRRLRAGRLLRHDLRRGNGGLRLPEIDVGQGGGASFLQRILPPSKVRRMMLTGERVPASELYRLGAVEACLPEAELLPAALAMASAIAAKSPGRRAAHPKLAS